MGNVAGQCNVAGARGAVLDVDGLTAAIGFGDRARIGDRGGAVVPITSHLSARTKAASAARSRARSGRGSLTPACQRTPGAGRPHFLTRLMQLHSHKKSWRAM